MKPAVPFVKYVQFGAHKMHVIFGKIECAATTMRWGVGWGGLHLALAVSPPYSAVPRLSSNCHTRTNAPPRDSWRQPDAIPQQTGRPGKHHGFRAMPHTRGTTSLSCTKGGSLTNGFRCFYKSRALMSRTEWWPARRDSGNRASGGARVREEVQGANTSQTNDLVMTN